MKKSKIKPLLLAAIATALSLESAETSSSTKPKDPSYGNMNYKLMTEDELLLELSDDGRSQYNVLDAEGKSLARKIASQRCAASNQCKGQNACATDKNACAGQGDCAGKTKCGFSDKNLAVKVASQVMAKKRAELLKK